MNYIKKIVLILLICVLVIMMLPLRVHAYEIIDTTRNAQADEITHNIVVADNGVLWYMPDAIPLTFLTDEEYAIMAESGQCITWEVYLEESLYRLHKQHCTQLIGRTECLPKDDMIEYKKLLGMDAHDCALCTATINAMVLCDNRSMEEITWDYWYMYLNGNTNGVAGLLGNMYAESGIRPTNLQGSYERILGMSDAEYTAAVDNGTYTNFVGDRAGYGLVQWTYSGYKRDVLTYAKEHNVSIGDIYMQNEFLYKQFHTKNLLGVLETLLNAQTVREASDCVLLRFERPANQGESAQVARCNLGLAVLDRQGYRCERLDEIRADINNIIELEQKRAEWAQLVDSMKEKIRNLATIWNVHYWLRDMMPMLY